jgi:glucose/arabinose dehydrogenase
VLHAGDGTDNLYIVEQGGTVRRIAKWRGSGPAAAPSTFFDISARCATRQQGGLMAIAFHPAYKQNGRFFAFYLAPFGSEFKAVVSEYAARGGVANHDSERVLLEIPKKLALHHGGALVFGPDGKLWIGTGDGGEEKNAVQTAQNMGSLLGKLLRIDVDGSTPPLAYKIPSDNPWPNAPGVRPEIWAYGMRNLWRLSFDASGAPWVATPGAARAEWITKATRGGNLGWPFYEGTHPLQPVPPARASEKFVLPAWQYDRASPDEGTCIIGGHFYRGTRVPALAGKYVFADYSRGQAYALDLNASGGSNWVLLGPAPSCADIGQDSQGELYFSDNDNGTIRTLAPN